ncbi:MAG: ABC transporter ATP-binding protein [Chloroflexi bacterium]|nr:ABC transporter ATP-binding protein [Chloroflexota bacterium]
MPDIIYARGLLKRFGDLVAVDGIDFSVAEGECYGMLGPNGAGKTSTIRMITCVSPLTGGELFVNGMDVRTEGRRIKAKLGVVSQEENLDPDLTVQQNLTVYARYYDIPAAEARRRADELLELFQLEDRRGEIVENLSGGMKRRLIVARALINQPRILVLDEPTTGLDPQARHLVWQKLRYLQSQGITMLVTTHYMEEAAHICNRLMVMHRGRILAEGPPKELIQRHVGRQVLELSLNDGRRQAALDVLRRREDLRLEDVENVLYVYGQAQEWEPLLEELALADEEVRLREATLEDVFLQLTGRGLEE